MAIKRWIGLMCLVAASLANQVTLAGECAESDTVQACIQKLTELPEQLRVKLVSKEASELRLKNTGAGTVSTQQSSAAADFLSLFAAAAETGATEDDSESLTFDLNNFLGLDAEDGYRVQAVVRDAKIFQPLKSAFADAMAADRASGLESELDDFDDIAFSVTYSPMNQRLGRKFSPHRGLAEGMLRSVTAGLDEDIRRRLLRIDRRIDEELEAAVEQGDLTEEEYESISTDNGFVGTFEQIPNEVLRAELMGAIEEYARSVVERSLRINKRAEATGLVHLSELVNNQPQLYFSVSVRERNDVAGPDERGLKATYEIGSVNINKFKQNQAGCLDNGAQEAACLRNYLTSQRISRLKKGDRLAVSIEYAEIGDYRAEYPDESVSLDLEGRSRLVGSLVYGRYVDFDEEGNGKGRIDITASYEDYENDDMNREDRRVASVIYSRPIGDEATFVVGMTWASNPEFLGDVQDNVSANLGLTYRLTRKDAK